MRADERDRPGKEIEKIYFTLLTHPYTGSHTHDGRSSD